MNSVKYKLKVLLRVKMSESDKLTEIMDKVEEFYFNDGEESGEAIFNKFAA